MLKKLIFAPIFLVAFASLVYQLNPLFGSYESIFSLSWTTLIQLTILTGLILLSSLQFILFATFAADWKLVLPVGVIAALIPLVFVTQPQGIVLAIGILISILLTFLTLENHLKSYLTFEPNSLLGPSIRQLAGLLVLVICLTYFLSINKIIQQNGFQIPDSLIDAALKFASPSQTGPIQQPVNILQDVLKQTIKDQLQNLLKPYSGFIPAILAVILFLTLQSLTSIFQLLIYPLLWIVFYLLEKTGYISYTTEQRPVKKIVIS